MPFKQIFDLLRRFENIRTHKKIIEEEILEWCLKKTNLKSEDISIKVRRPHIIVATQNMGAKTAIFTSQNSLFQLLKAKFGDKAPDSFLFK